MAGIRWGKMIKNFYLCFLVFDKNYYLSKYPEVKNYRWGAFGHAMRYGIRENRSISPWIDPEFYLERYPESQLSGISATEHYLLHGWKQGYIPGPKFDPRFYLKSNPDVAAAETNPVLHFVKFGSKEGRFPKRTSPSEIGSERRTLLNSGETVENLIRLRWLSNEPIRLLHNSGEQPRVHLVTDSFGPESLFGGVATSLIIAALVANKMGYGLCLVTRHNPSVDLGKVSQLLSHFGVELLDRLDHEHLAPDSSNVLATHNQDVFIGTSWWTTYSILASVINPNRIVYILQEDEREFYPSGDERLRAAAIMNESRIKVMVNTDHLMQYLIGSGIQNLTRTGVSFEPSFEVYSKTHIPSVRKYKKKRLFFYARPNNYRNLFYLGLEALDRALLDGVIDPNIWDIVLVGKDLPEIIFSDGTQPILAGNQTFVAYKEFISTFDAGISLMATPHPSYPPFDLAMSGVPVLTNSWPGKPDLTIISPLIEMVEPSTGKILEGINKLMKQDRIQPKTSNLKAPYSKSWIENLSEPINSLAEWLGK